MNRIQAAVKDLKGQWPDGPSSHYYGFGNALYDRRMAEHDALVCTREEFEGATGGRHPPIITKWNKREDALPEPRSGQIFVYDRHGTFFVAEYDGHEFQCQHDYFDEGMVTHWAYAESPAVEEGE